MKINDYCLTYFVEKEAEVAEEGSSGEEEEEKEEEEGPEVGNEAQSPKNGVPMSVQENSSRAAAWKYTDNTGTENGQGNREQRKGHGNREQGKGQGSRDGNIEQGLDEGNESSDLDSEQEHEMDLKHKRAAQAEDANDSEEETES